MPEVLVTFTVTQGGGTITGSPTSTNSDGIAAVGSWTLGGPGLNGLDATVANLNPLAVRATAVPRTPATLIVVAGDGQTGWAGTLLPVNPSVRVLDQLQEPIRGVPIQFHVVAGGGTGIAVNTISDPLGVATVGGWQLGPEPGQNALTASVIGHESISAVITAWAGPRPPAHIEVVAGDHLSAPANTVLPTMSAVRVLDTQGMVLSGQEVVFTPSAGKVESPVGAGFRPSVTTSTDSQGIAKAAWLLPTSAGGATLHVRAAGPFEPQATLSATVLAGPATTLTLTQQPSIGAQPCVPLQRQPILTLADTYGNPITGTASNVDAEVFRSVDGFVNSPRPLATIIGQRTAIAQPDGKVVFDSLAIDYDDSPFDYTTVHFLRFRHGSITVDSPTRIQVLKAIPHHLVITRQPEDTLTSSGATIPIVGVRDACGRRVDFSTSPILGVGVRLEGPAGGVLPFDFGYAMGSADVEWLVHIAGPPGTYYLVFYAKFYGSVHEPPILPVRSDPFVIR